MTNELQLLKETLEKKQKILRQILDKTLLQQELAGAESLDAEQFDRLVDDKTELLAQMEKLDEGFDSTYQRIKNELSDEKGRHQTEIAGLQELIKGVVDTGAQIHAAEARTKEQLSHALAKSKKELARKRVSYKKVMDYYKASNNLKYVDPYFLDQKK